MADSETKKKSLFNRILDVIERAGNKLPDAFILFLWICVALIALTVILSALGVSAIHPVTGETVTIQNLLSPSSLVKLFTGGVANFSGFAPLGAVLVCTLGIGLCEKSGLLKVAITHGLSNLKGSSIKVIVLLVFLSIVSLMAGDSAFIIMPPLGAMIFMSIGRNPLAGMMLAYASVAGGYGGNVFPSVLDVLLSGFTANAAATTGITTVVNPLMNYFFGITSVIVVMIVATWVTVKFVEPRLGKLENYEIEKVELVADVQRKGMKWALISLIIYIAILCVTVVPTNGIFRDPETHNIISLRAPFMNSLVIIVTLAFLIPGLVFGKITGTIPNGGAMVKALNKSMSEMGGFIVLTFILAQFTALFNWSNLGIVLAINGANGIKAMGLPIPVVMVLLILFVIVLDIFLGSASAKWAVLAPIIVPMFMFLGFHPAFSQMIYRIGDAVINVCTPLLAYYMMLLALGQKYDKDLRLGTLIATMLPYSIFYFIAWVIQLLVWYFFRLPFGPGGPLLLS